MVRTLAIFVLLFQLSAFAQKKAIRPPKPNGGPYSSGIESGSLVYVSGHVGPEPGGGFAPFDIRTQTRRCLDLVGKVLAEAGLGPEHIVSTTLYLTDIRTVDAADAAWREYFHGGFPARTDIESQLLIPEALVEVSAVAVKDLSKKRIITPQGWPEPKRPVSYAVEADGTLFLSGVRPVDPVTGKLAGPTISLQAGQAMKNQAALLQAAGYGAADIASIRAYVSDAAFAPGLEAAFRSSVKASPGRAVIQTPPVETGHLLQLQTVAAKSSAPRKIYVSGMTGRQANGTFSAGDIKAQTRQALQSIEQQLSRHGMTLADAIDSVVWIRDGRLAGAMNEVYREIVKPNPPARATVRVAPLDADALVQIMMIASK